MARCAAGDVPGGGASTAGSPAAARLALPSAQSCTSHRAGPPSHLRNCNSLALFNSSRVSCFVAHGALLIDAPLSARWTQDASDLYNADYAQTEELFRRLLSSSAGKLRLASTGGQRCST